jgi:multidrug transporter EmrE-like cation transporter
MRGVPLTTVGLFGAAVVAQVISISVLPRTLGFTNLTYTLVCLIAFDLSLWICARLFVSGVSLGVLIPTMSALVPLASILVGIVAYHELASIPRLVLLVTACGLIGVAASFG